MTQASNTRLCFRLSPEQGDPEAFGNAFKPEQTKAMPTMAV